MAGRRTLASYGITSYRVTIALSNGEWEKLRAEAERGKMRGAELIERILQDVCAALPTPTPEPLPDDPGDQDTPDMVQIV